MLVMEVQVYKFDKYKKSFVDSTMKKKRLGTRNREYSKVQNYTEFHPYQKPSDWPVGI